MRSDIDEAAIAEAVGRGDVVGALDRIPWDHFREFEALLLLALLALIREAGAAGVDYLPDGVDGGFDRDTADAVNWAERRAEEAVALMVLSSRTAMERLIRDGISSARPAADIASDVKAFAGLLERQVGNLEKMQERMLAAGATAEEAIAAATIAARQLLDDRATMIAGNETMIAVNEGLRQLWRQLLEKDLITRAAFWRVWEVTPPDVCPVCIDLDGTTAPIDGHFAHGYEPGEVHVNCKCIERLERAA